MPRKILPITVTTIVAIWLCNQILLPSEYTFPQKALSQSINEQKEKLEDELDNKDSELEKAKKKAEEISKQIDNYSKDLNVNLSQIKKVQAQIIDLSKDIQNINAKLDIKKTELSEKNKIKEAILRSVYISNQRNILDYLLSANKSIADATNETGYYLSFMSNSNNLIELINKDIVSYESDRQGIEEIKVKVEAQKVSLQKIATTLTAKVNNAKQDLTKISQQQEALAQDRAEIKKKLSELSAQQQAALNEKTETFTTSVGDIPATGDPASSPAYDPGFKNAFAGFSFGAPHRKGMSQYGAKGRAEAGQNYKDILKAYYGDIEIREVDGLPSNIKTDKGTMEFEGKYLKGIAEMTSSWPKEALKAQAIAARTYALTRIGWSTDNKSTSGSICTNENCQVWSSTKASASSAKPWHDAVSSTKGEVLVSKKTGDIFSPLYAATSGGFNYSYSSAGHTTSGGWDTKCGSRSCWTSDAYESKAGSPWFYKGWYKTRSNQSCSRKHPWLTEEEFADIVGAVILYKEKSDNQKHLSQVDANKCWGKNVGDTWSISEVREKSGVRDIDSVSVSYSSDGTTSQVKIKSNKGDHTFSGSDFKAIFNLRAPGAIQLKSLLFNIEVKD
jgi:peptidoglycan hydrolase-like amidase